MKCKSDFPNSRPERKKIVLAPLDPVHDVGLKLIRRKLVERGHEVTLLPPDLSPEEVVARAKALEPDFLMVSRAISYGTSELLAKFVDLCDASGLRERTKIAAGGLSMRPEMAQELGFDAGFGPDTPPEAAVAYVEGREAQAVECERPMSKVDLTAGFSYEFRDKEIGDLCLRIARQLVNWAQDKTSPGVERARLRLDMEEARAAGDEKAASEIREKYAGLCGGEVERWYRTGEPVAHTRLLSDREIEEISRLKEGGHSGDYPRSQDILARYNVFIQYGTGCPVMDAYHINLSLAFGARGVIHFDPSWGARTEGLLEGAWSHQHDGTVLTLDNLRLIKNALLPGTMWQVRAHRGLNTPETVILAHLAGADLTKINIVYGSLGAGTDPARLAVDGIESMRLAARFGLPYDVVTNEELCGVPAKKAFAGMLIVATAGVLLGGRPILQPLFANSPEAIIAGLTEDNFIDFNAAKMEVLREIIDAPIWPGAPVGFLTQSQDRCQSSTMTALHAALALKIGAQAVTIASSDEAYAGGPITAPARVDTLKTTAAALRFFGSAGISPSRKAKDIAQELRQGILDVLKAVAERGDFVASLYEGLLGDKEDGAYPGRAGRDTVKVK
ncbi:MAG: cobalamin B12-binding domain-containing protein [Candidatus Fermentithermobacillus carboniphilus]|uniref:Cobalamin B12-binding domain-containing protein n=1 Tax=Candidatus Fermentithermobacillus carboniphilus TaxID=3085328 RepID=A0AAT9LFE8_9FIRM|nr:MAG: cobalamin B12-binding domain-containing protein [Candidatus Fermentithermobacillus carboniphilus]